MNKIKYRFWGLLLALTVLWLLADSFFPEPFTYFSFRNVFMQYSGVLGIGVMSVAMLIATRPGWLERRWGGLDKMYRLHKWLGIAGLVIAIVHWWWAQGTKWMVHWGWLVRPQRRRGAGAGADLGLIEGWLRSQRGIAESLGEWAFYAVVILIALALIKRFPYRLFVKTHRWIAAVYLVLAYHAAILFKFSYWPQPLGWAMAALLLAGTASAALVLSGRVGARRKTQGTIESVTLYPELRVIEAAVRLQEGWRGHAAGQFAFVTFNPKEGAHPYTIASSWDPAARRIVFIIKALGDHTGALLGQLKAGDAVTVEGPYGCFDFRDRHARQIWIGAGIGITPFIARMKQLAQQRASHAIDLFHPTADFDQAAIDKLTADARAAGVRLHLLRSPRDGVLDAAAIRAAVPDWQKASIWFCGPAAFGSALRRDFVGRGLRQDDFHQELFQMR
ncbi:ferredoxin reductase family protein [Noviherbaspirillum autotrophicum]|uniref:Ferric reductase n=1 Tax=Noviherbaspirillum autotrophicum TaxID=709839 RepID=A0A0C1YHV9_9BURK|nr:ferric reductase-like transmembrane domain-containing protein [Noviherbaspirillum autotrophicum]KIF80097.1 ferric reductase [Noviherbaspirillum autotrophicum]